MAIRVKYGSTWLTCEDLGDIRTHSAALNLRKNGSLVVQSEDLIRADYAFLAARGNRKNSISFDVARRYAAYNDACAQALIDFEELATSDTIEFHCGGVGDSLKKVTAATGYLSGHSAPVQGSDGVYLVTHYEIVCGQLTLVEGGAPIIGTEPAEGGGSEGVKDIPVILCWPLPLVANSIFGKRKTAKAETIVSVRMELLVPANGATTFDLVDGDGVTIGGDVTIASGAKIGSASASIARAVNAETQVRIKTAGADDAPGQFLIASYVIEQ
jgi:hypothetical protein